MVVNEAFVGLFLPKVLYGVGPEDVAHQALGRRLPEAVDLGMKNHSATSARCKMTRTNVTNVVEGVQLG